MTIYGQKIANAPLGSFPVHNDRITATGNNCQIVKLDVGAVGVSSLVTGALPININSSLVPYAYDYISLSYTGADLTTVVFKTGGAGGTTVATLTLTYIASVLQTVTRT